jgi:hypothetical protein
VQLHREMQVGYCRLVTVSTVNLLETNEFSAVPAPTDVSLRPRTQSAAISTSETRTAAQPDDPHTLVLEPDLRVYKIYNGIGSSVGRPWRNCRTCALC